MFEEFDSMKTSEVTETNNIDPKNISMNMFSACNIVFFLLNVHVLLGASKVSHVAQVRHLLSSLQ